MRAMKVKHLIKHLAHIPADAEVAFIDKYGYKHYLDTVVGFYGGENAEMHVFEDTGEDE